MTSNEIFGLVLAVVLGFISIWSVLDMFCPPFWRWRNRRKYGCDDPFEWHSWTMPSGETAERRYIDGPLLDIDMNGYEIHGEGRWDYRDVRA